MRRILLAVLIFVSPALAAVLSVTHATAAPPSPLHAGCWGVFEPADKVTADSADEVLCVDESGRASIRESSMFGEGVKGCNVVTIRSQGDKLIIDINYARCTNNSPNHTLTCGPQSASGEYSCTFAFADGSKSPVKLAPLPAGE